MNGLRTPETGDPVIGQKCPWCRKETVVYNGNYFCINEKCEWSMSDNEQPKRIIVAYLWQRYYEAKDKGDEETMHRMMFYLKEKS